MRAVRVKYLQSARDSAYVVNSLMFTITEQFIDSTRALRYGQVIDTSVTMLYVPCQYAPYIYSYPSRAGMYVRAAVYGFK